jgi:hypothetical protein
MRTFVSVLAILLMVFTATPRVNAQTSHVVTQSTLDAALQQHVTDVARTREDVLRALNRPEVKDVANRVGIDLRSAATAVASLDGQELTEVAAQARQVDQALAGGQSRVTISTTMIIIGLLILVLIIVAVK